MRKGKVIMNDELGGMWKEWSDRFFIKVPSINFKVSCPVGAMPVCAKSVLPKQTTLVTMPTILKHHSMLHINKDSTNFCPLKAARNF
jgi:hypothetical protein